MNADHLYSVDREFNVSIDKLWHAWTDASALEAWHHPVGMSCVTGATESDMKIGGLWSYAVQVPGRESISYFFGKYTSVAVNSGFEHSMHYTESRDEFALKDFNTPAHRISVDFESRGEKSWAKFSQFGQAPEAQVAMMAKGIESYFESLEEFLKA